MAITPEPMPENPINFRAPPPSPVAPGRRSSVTNDDVLTEYLEHSLRVPELILPDKIFPRQNNMEAPPRIDFLSLSDSIPSILDSLSRIGCFQLVNHGISSDSRKSVLATAAGIFSVSPEKRKAVTRSAEKPFGFEEVHGEVEGEEFVWCSDENLQLTMEGIWPIGYSKFREKIKTLSAQTQEIAEKILSTLLENLARKPTYYADAMERHDSVCCIYKHKKTVSGVPDRQASSVGYDVIRMFIKGCDYTHALCLHVFDEPSAEFHVYSKKGWISFCPDKDALIVTIGDQTQAVSAGQYKHVIGRPIFKDEKEHYTSMAFLYCPSISSSSDNKITNANSTNFVKGKTISLGQQVIVAIILTLVYNFYSSHF